MNEQDERLPVVKTIWLHLLIEGGRWKPVDMRRLLGCHPRRLDALLYSMKGNGYLTSFRDDGRKNGVAYGVTPQCRIPGGVTLRDLALSPVETAKACEKVRHEWGAPSLIRIAANSARAAA